VYTHLAIFASRGKSGRFLTRIYIREKETTKQLKNPTRKIIGKY